MTTTYSAPGPARDMLGAEDAPVNSPGSVVAGFDLQLGAAPYHATINGQNRVAVVAYDSDGNYLATLADVPEGTDWLALLPALIDVARDLYPTHASRAAYRRTFGGHA